MYCQKCGRPNAEKHHIVFKSQGGLDIKVNYKWLCYECHRGNNGPHLNRERDLELKREEQERLFLLFKEEERYQIKEIAEKIGYDRKRLEKRFEKVRNCCGEYEAEDIVRRLMGGKIY